ncbi:MAG: hypothetical protein JO166_18345 [Deltaproteobacteria bacterium]|nr:hypothetical protein [Deltaproteobacteria bacterium]
MLICEIPSYILRTSAGIAFAAALVVLAIKLPGGVADAVGLGDANACRDQGQLDRTSMIRLPPGRQPALRGWTTCPPWVDYLALPATPGFISVS